MKHYLDPLLQKRIQDKLKRLRALRPLPRIVVEKLRQQFQIEMAYNTNGLEGNQLTLRETTMVINEGFTIKGKSLRDHLEAKDQHEALEYLYQISSEKEPLILTEALIRHVHQLVVKETDQEWAGQYRNRNIKIAGATHTPPEAINLPAEMHKLITWFKAKQIKLHPIELAAIIHHKLVYLHPFFDGNGRTARLIASLILLKNDYPLPIVLKNDRRRYYRVLALADKGDYLSLAAFFARVTERSLDIYLKTLTPINLKGEKFVPLSMLAPKSPYSAKYLNLLAGQGKLEAHKEGRLWLSSLEAVNCYRLARRRKR